MGKKLHGHYGIKIIISLMILWLMLFAMPIKGTHSLSTTLSNSTVNQFTFVEDNQVVDYSTNDTTSTTDSQTEVNTNTKTSDDTNINLLLAGMLIGIGGLAYCWIKENKQKEEKNDGEKEKLGH